MRHLDRDLKLLAAANLLFALGLGLYYQLLFVYAIKELDMPRVWIGVLTAVMLATTAASGIPGAWAAHRFRLKPVIVAVWWVTVPAAICFALAPSWPWLVPGFFLSGCYMANNPAFKAYIYLKSAPERVARNITLVFGTYPAGLVVAPLAGGYLAAHVGMRPVFWISAGVFALSSSAATLIRDTPYHAAGDPWSWRTLRENRRFRRYIGFFLAGFSAVYIGQPFLSPYLAQVHGQGFQAVGVYAALAALGGAMLTVLGGRIGDLRGPRYGVVLCLVCLVAGPLLLWLGWAPPLWAAGMFLCGAFDAFRFVAAGIVGDTFGAIPLAWGYAIFDSMMGLPMAGGAIIGGLLYRAAFGLPFAVVIAVASVLIAVLLFMPERDREPAPAGVAQAPETGVRTGV